MLCRCRKVAGQSPCGQLLCLGRQGMDSLMIDAIIKAGPFLRLINAARLFPHGPSRELPLRHRTAACVTELQLHRLRLRVRLRLSAVTGTLVSSLCYGEDKFIRNRGRRAAYNGTNDN